VNDRLAAALDQRLRLQISVSSVPIVEEWMDTPLTRWFDSVPLPPEMPDGEAPELVVSLGSDARLLRWRAGGAPAGVVPRLVDYLRRAGALPSDFRRLDELGQALEPAVVGSWIEVRPGAVATGWFVSDRMALARAREILGETWLEPIGDGVCLEIRRSVGADPITWVVIELAGAESEKRGAAGDVLARLGLAFDHHAAASLGGELALGLRARRGRVVSSCLVASRPSAGAEQVCAAMGMELSPAVGAVERAIGAGELVHVEVERSADGAAVVLEYVARATRASAN
jgi:hypothetical protein